MTFIGFHFNIWNLGEQRNGKPSPQTQMLFEIGSNPIGIWKDETYLTMKSFSPTVKMPFVLTSRPHGILI